MIVVPDAGPLIYLAGAGQLHLLPILFREVITPRVVFEEVVVVGAGLVGSAEVASAPWLRVVEAAPEASLVGPLDAGEAAAIPLAERLGATLLADDAAARAVAQGRGLVVVGTLGVLLRAKQLGLVTEVGPTLDRMRGLGMFVSAPLRKRVLELAGESE